VLGEDAPMGEEGAPHDQGEALLGLEPGFQAPGTKSRDPLSLSGVVGQKEGVGQFPGERTIHLIPPEVSPPSIRHISEVQVGVHELMVPVQKMNGSSYRLSLPPKATEKSEDLLLVVPPVQDIPCLDHDQVTSHPAIIFIDGSCQPEGGPGCLQIPMQVSNGHDSGLCFGRFMRFGNSLPSRVRTPHKENEAA
jgi:hypothetical protein